MHSLLVYSWSVLYLLACVHCIRSLACTCVSSLGFLAGFAVGTIITHLDNAPAVRVRACACVCVCVRACVRACIANKHITEHGLFTSRVCPGTNKLVFDTPQSTKEAFPDVSGDLRPLPHPTTTRPSCAHMRFCLRISCAAKQSKNQKPYH